MRANIFNVQLTMLWHCSTDWLAGINLNFPINMTECFTLTDFCATLYNNFLYEFALLWTFFGPRQIILVQDSHYIRLCYRSTAVFILPAKQYHNVYWSLSCFHTVATFQVNAHHRQPHCHHTFQCKQERDVWDGYQHTSLQFLCCKHIPEMKDSSM